MDQKELDKLLQTIIDEVDGNEILEDLSLNQKMDVAIRIFSKVVEWLNVEKVQ